MNVDRIFDRLMALGLTDEQRIGVAKAIIETLEYDEEERRAGKREANRRRQARHRARSNVTRDETATGDNA